MKLQKIIKNRKVSIVSKKASHERTTDRFKKGMPGCN